MCAAVSKPSIPGISTSSRTTANSWRSSAFIASSPDSRPYERHFECAEHGFESDEVVLPVVDEEDARLFGRVGVRGDAVPAARAVEFGNHCCLVEKRGSSRVSTVPSS